MVFLVYIIHLYCKMFILYSLCSSIFIITCCCLFSSSNHFLTLIFKSSESLTWPIAIVRRPSTFVLPVSSMNNFWENLDLWYLQDFLFNGRRREISEQRRPWRSFLGVKKLLNWWNSLNNFFLSQAGLMSTKVRIAQ